MGPIGILCVQRTLNNGRASGMYTGIGAAISDLFYCLLAGFGLSIVTDFIEENITILQIAGSVILIVYSLFMIIRNPVNSIKDTEKGFNPTRDLITGFFFTLSNPLILFRQDGGADVAVLVLRLFVNVELLVELHYRKHDAAAHQVPADGLRPFAEELVLGAALHLDVDGFADVLSTRHVADDVRFLRPIKPCAADDEILSVDDFVVAVLAIRRGDVAQPEQLLAVHVHRIDRIKVRTECVERSHRQPERMPVVVEIVALLVKTAVDAKPDGQEIVNPPRPPVLDRLVNHRLQHRLDIQLQHVGADTMQLMLLNGLGHDIVESDHPEVVPFVPPAYELGSELAPIGLHRTLHGHKMKVQLAHILDELMLSHTSSY